MVYILWGEDEFSLTAALEKIRKSLGDKTLLEVNTTTLDGQELTLNQLKSVCDSVPFLAKKRLVIINGLLTRFDPGDRASQAKKTNSPGGQQDECGQLADCLNKVPESTLVVLVDAIKLKGANPLFKLVAPKAVVQSFPMKYGLELHKWIQERVAAEGGRISPGATRLLAQLVGGNLRNMANEIKKLILFTSGHPIGEQDIKAVVSEAQEFDVFAMIDGIFDSRAGLAEQILQQLLEKGVAPTHLMTMLSRQVRMIVVAKELKSQRKSAAEIRAKLGITLEFIWRKMLQQIDKYSMEQLKHIYLKLLETDLAIKTGKYNEELALNMLVAELCQRSRL